MFLRESRHDIYDHAVNLMQREVHGEAYNFVDMETMQKAWCGKR